MHVWMIIVPSLVVAFATALRNASGPFWLGENLDPEYMYLLNSLSLTQGLPVGHAHNPGSTLQWVGALWLFVINIFLGKDDLITDVLTRPEFYLAHLQVALLSILFFTLFIAGWLAFKWTGDTVVALLMQLGICLSFTARNAFPRMNPELLLIILGVWLAITVLYHSSLNLKAEYKEPFWQYGLIAGLGLGLKLTFLPLCVLPLILLKRLSHRLGYLGITGVVFFCVTANPLMDFKGFLDFTFNQIVARQGHNRPLVPGSNTFQAMIDGLSLLLANMWHWEKPLLVLLIIFVINGLWFLSVSNYRQPNHTESWNRRLWAGLLLTLLGQVVMVANGPRAWLHYMCPLLGLTSLFAISIWTWSKTGQTPQVITPVRQKAIYLGVMICLIVITILKVPGELQGARAGTRIWQEANQFKAENQLLNQTTVYYYRSSSIQYALALGNDWARRHFTQPLASIYPDFFYFSPLDNRIFGQFGANHVTIEDVVNHAGTVLIQGQLWDPPILPLLEQKGIPLYNQTGNDRGAPGPSKELSNLIPPTHSQHAFSAEVLFRGSVEWIILLRSRH